jgi:sec-independent protein translocase protein TatB
VFDLFSWSHILILLIVALVVVGPKDLPRLMRTAGQWAGKARAMAGEFRRSFDEMARQSELDELRKEIESLRNERPLADIESELHSSVLPPEHRSQPEVAAPEPVVDHDHVNVGEEAKVPEPEEAQAVAAGPPAP